MNRGIQRGLGPAGFLPPWAGGADLTNDGGSLVADSSAGGGIRLLTAPAEADATIATLESTTSTSYIDLVTAGPTVTVNVGPSGKVKLALFVGLATGTTDGGRMAFAVSGATTRAAAATQDLFIFQSTGGASIQAQMSATFMVTGLTPGRNTFTAKYKSIAGASVSFFNRSMTVEAIYT